MIRKGYQCNQMMQFITDLMISPLWERACSRMRCHSRHQHRLNQRFREQARSHRVLWWIDERRSPYPCHPPPYRCQESTHAP
ncbi:hypothetical protein FHG55_28060 [Pseudomonas jessenii]|uniref:Uncharacterized protein n=1 Tax=Pseudomonas jessenii TaxID=77298 RepID=A0A5C4KPP8_PSEJE|nr:hypothetical protein FHG55_28060 [Pseudomonas jessenii]